MKKAKVLISLFLVLITLVSTLSISASAVSFSDVPNGKWFTEAVKWCASHSLVNGYPDGTFRPNRCVSRAELSQILYAAALNIQNFYGDNRIVDNTTKIKWIGSSYGGDGASGNVCFQYASVLKSDMDTLSAKACPYSDVQPGDWYVSAVRWCYHKGFYDGFVTGSKFYPNKTLTRQEAMTMIFRFWFAITQIYKNDYVQWTWPWNHFDRINNSGKKITNYGYDDRNPGSNPIYLTWGFAESQNTYNRKKTAMYTVFTDAGQISDYAVPAMVWAVSSKALKARTNDDFSWGFLNGTGQYVLSPKGELTRAQIATIMYRIFVDLAPGHQPWWSLN